MPYITLKFKFFKENVLKVKFYGKYWISLKCSPLGHLVVHMVSLHILRNGPLLAEDAALHWGTCQAKRSLGCLSADHRAQPGPCTWQPCSRPGYGLPDTHWGIGWGDVLRALGSLVSSTCVSLNATKEDAEKLSSLCLGAPEPEMDSVVSESYCLGLNPSSAARQLNDLGQAPQPLCVSLFSFAKSDCCEA